jgi:hypothetical protein
MARKSGAAGVVLLTLCPGQFLMMLDTFQRRVDEQEHRPPPAGATAADFPLSLVKRLRPPCGSKTRIQLPARERGITRTG